MKDLKGRDRVEIQYASREVDTTNALIELYKSAFGEQWKDAYSATVRFGLTGC